jgi:pilus assembly protein Flp/PilA
MLNFLWRRTRRDESGASAVEYGLLIAGVAALIVVIVFAFGGTVNNMFNKSCTTIQSTTATSATC